MIEKASEQGLEKLFNYGVLGVMVVLLIIALVVFVRHYIKRQSYWEKKLDDKSKDQLAMTEKFLESVNQFKEVQKDHNLILSDLKDNGAEHTEVLRELKFLIHNHQ